MPRPIVPISVLGEGQTGAVRGRVRRVGELLTSPVGRRPCVYWAVYAAGDAAEPREQQATEFWVEDPGGRALVRVHKLAVDARAERQQRVLEQVEQDIHAVERRQRELRIAIRQGRGDVPAAQRERLRLAEVATLLCAVRARARGRVHIGPSPKAQDKWIAEHANASSGCPGAATVRLVVDEWEVVLEEGHEIEVEGRCAREVAPAGTGVGYRDPGTCLVLLPDDSGAVTIRGLGAASAGDAPRSPDEPPGTRVPKRPGADPSPASPASKRSVYPTAGLVLVVCAVLAAVAWWLAR